MSRCFIAIGGGEIKNKTTLEIDRYIASKIKNRANGERGNALFIGTASHDSMPYFNSFRKTYTSVFDIKVDVALMVYGEMNLEHIQAKIEKADCIYVGGGDTIFMLETWKQKGFLDLLLKAYQDEKIICGLSAGAIYPFEKMYTDHELATGGTYEIYDGLGILPGCMSPHYDNRPEFDEVIIKENIPFAYAVENDAAIEFLDEAFSKSISSGGKSYMITNQDGVLQKQEL